MGAVLWRKAKPEKYRAKALECEALAQAARDPFIQWVCHLGSGSARLGLSQKGGLPRSGERYSHLVQGRQTMTFTRAVAPVGLRRGPTSYASAAGA
jgi:hypothetical protein